MYEIVAAIIGLIGTTGGKAIDKTTQQIVQEGITSRAFIESGKQVAISGWDAVGKGYSTEDALSQALAKKTLEKAANQRAKQDEEEKFKRILIIGGLCAAALLVLIIVLKKK